MNTSFGQVNDPKLLDSLFNKVKEIKIILDNSKSDKEEIKILKKELLNDSLILNEKDKKILGLSNAVEILKKEKDSLTVQNKQVITDFQNSKLDYSNLSDKQIEILFSEEFNGRGSLTLSSELLKSILSIAQKTPSKRLNQINVYLEIYDSIVSINKIFEKPYSEELKKETYKRIDFVASLAKQKIPGNDNVILSELNKLKDRNRDYCKNTLELYTQFYNVLPLSKSTELIFNIDKSNSVFIKKTEQLYYLVYKYKYLLKALNDYTDIPAFREQFKNKPTFTCN